MEHGNVIVRFDQVTFLYDDKLILDEASFSIRENAKITIMGQNGAGKSTIFKLILSAAGMSSDEGVIKPKEGRVSITDNATIAIARQVMPRELFGHTVLEYFESAFLEKRHDIEKLIKDVLEVVQVAAPLDKKMKDFSGGQLARLLLAHALIQKPDILLLDEPTNNLDSDGIDHLTGFLMAYEKTVIVISHDANFLNCFTEGVLNLDFLTKKVEQYVGNYFDVVEEIRAQIEREEKKNAQLRKNIQDRKDKVNFFSHKGGKMRKLASKLKEEVEEDEEEMVDVKKDDKTMRPFIIPAQPWSDVMVNFSAVGVIQNHERKVKKVDIKLWRRNRLQITGPNGIGKSTLLRELASGESEGAKLSPELKVAYYQQDFSGLDFDKTAYESLAEMMITPDPKDIYSTAAHFLLTADMLKSKVGFLSEGQKGLLCYARFVLQKPGLLILDEPTNHINFRHLPAIAQAIDSFEGAVILVSHMPEFVEQIKITDTLDLGTILRKK